MTSGVARVEGINEAGLGLRSSALLDSPVRTWMSVRSSRTYSTRESSGPASMFGALLPTSASTSSTWLVPLTMGLAASGTGGGAGLSVEAADALTFAGGDGPPRFDTLRGTSPGSGTDALCG